MTSLSPLARAWLVAVAILLAASPSSAQRLTRELVVQQNSGELVQLPSAATSVLVANPDIADVQAPAANMLMVFGRKPGRTSVYALGPSGQALAALSVKVTQKKGTVTAAMIE